MIVAGPYSYRVNQPGYGPKIISSILSDLGPFSTGVGPFTDLRYNTTNFVGSGPPTAATLLAGNYDAALPGTGYITGDWYFDYTNKNLYGCTTAGSNASSDWSQISGSSAISAYQISVVNQNTVGGGIILPNGTNGDLTTINKPLELQGSLASETIDGTVITYSDYADSYNLRLATDASGATEDQYITPRYTVGQIIIGIQVVYYGLTEISPSRQWGGVNT